MLSLTHVLLIALVLLLFLGKTTVSDVGRGLGQGLRNFKKALRGDEDIDITHTVKRLEDNDDRPSE